VRRFVKSADTSTSVSSSQRDLERILRRYGASDFNLGSDWEKRIARVAFRVPDTPGSKVSVPVRLEVSIEAVGKALFGHSSLSKYGWEQAERVAWRHLVLWVDAACSASGAGMQTMSEAFLAHTLVRSPDGTIKKVSAMMDDAAGTGGYRALLPAAT